MLSAVLSTLNNDVSAKFITVIQLSSYIFKIAIKEVDQIVFVVPMLKQVGDDRVNSIWRLVL